MKKLIEKISDFWFFGTRCNDYLWFHMFAGGVIALAVQWVEPEVLPEYVIGLVAFLAFKWELFEMLIEKRYIKRWGESQNYESWFHFFSDAAFDIAGAVVIAWMIV